MVQKQLQVCFRVTFGLDYIKIAHVCTGRKEALV